MMSFGFREWAAGKQGWDLATESGNCCSSRVERLEACRNIARQLRAYGDLVHKLKSTQLAELPSSFTLLWSCDKQCCFS